MIMLEFMAINVTRERVSALNWIRMEFMAINVTRERKSVSPRADLEIINS